VQLDAEHRIGGWLSQVSLLSALDLRLANLVTIAALGAVNNRVDGVGTTLTLNLGPHHAVRWPARRRLAGLLV